MVVVGGGAAAVVVVAGGGAVVVAGGGGGGGVTVTVCVSVAVGISVVGGAGPLLIGNGGVGVRNRAGVDPVCPGQTGATLPAGTTGPEPVGITAVAARAGHPAQDTRRCHRCRIAIRHRHRFARFLRPRWHRCR